MDELRRTRYLQAIGVDIYVPRLILSGAKTSAQAATPIVYTNPGSDSPVNEKPGQTALTNAPHNIDIPPERPTIAESDVRGVVDSILGTLGDSKNSDSKNGISKSSTLKSCGPLNQGSVDQELKPSSAEVIHADQSESKKSELTIAQDSYGSSDSINAETQSEKVETPPPSVVGDNVHFTLNLWQPNEFLYLVDSHVSGQGLPTTTLLANILRAVGISSSPMNPETIQWPTLGGAGGWSEASELVHGFLDARLESSTVRYLWLMGYDAYTSFSNDHNYSSVLGQTLSVSRFNFQVAVLPSLSDMLVNPSLKSLAWSAIRDKNVTS